MHKLNFLLLFFCYQIIFAYTSKKWDGASFCSNGIDSSFCGLNEKKIFFNFTNKQCEEYDWGGCEGGSKNHFDDVIDCIITCHPMDLSLEHNLDACEQPRNIGPCRGKFPKFFYNSTSERCEMFIFGGCEANANNFETETECYNRCNSKKRLPLRPKPLTTKSGTNIKRFGPVIKRFNQNKDVDPGWKIPQTNMEIPPGSVGSSFYFNIGPNSRSINAPQDSTFENVASSALSFGTYNFGRGLDKSDDLPNPKNKNHLPKCTMPLIIGNCKLNETRFWHNPNTGYCEQFNYSGCGANENLHLTANQCVKDCSALGLVIDGFVYKKT